MMMNSRVKFFVKKHYSTQQPKPVLSVINLTTDFLPAQKKSLSKFHLLNPRRHKSMDYRLLKNRIALMPHYRKQLKSAVNENCQNKSVDDILNFENLEVKC